MAYVITILYVPFLGRGEGEYLGIGFEEEKNIYSLK